MAERTKIWISEALKRLMKKKSLEKIRVTEICKEAEIERPTFYYHFKDKYDLVTWIYLQDVEGIGILNLEKDTAALNKLRHDFVFYKKAFEDVTAQNPLWNYILEYYVKKFSDAAMQLMNTDKLDEEIIFTIRHYVYGNVWTMVEWILKNDSMPAEKYITMCFQAMPDKLKEIFYKTDQ